MSFEDLSSETVYGKEVKFKKSTKFTPEGVADYEVSLPIGFKVRETFWVNAENKEEVIDILKNNGVLEDEYGNPFRVVEAEDSKYFEIHPA